MQALLENAARTRPGFRAARVKLRPPLLLSFVQTLAPTRGARKPKTRTGAARAVYEFLERTGRKFGRPPAHGAQLGAEVRFFEGKSASTHVALSLRV
jgi:hypothetical protein